MDSKPEPPSKSSKTKKDVPLSSSVKKAKKKPVVSGKVGQTPGAGSSRVSSIQSLLNAASLLESAEGSETSPSSGRSKVGGVESSGRSKEHHPSRSTDIWNANLRCVCVCLVYSFKGRSVQNYP